MVCIQLKTTLLITSHELYHQTTEIYINYFTLIYQKITHQPSVLYMTCFELKKQKWVFVHKGVKILNLNAPFLDWSLIYDQLINLLHGG